MLAVGYPTVRIEAASAVATSEDWLVVALYALATALKGDPGRAVAFAAAAYDALQTMCGPLDEATLTAQRALAVAQQTAGDCPAAVNTTEAVHAASRRAHG